MMKKIIALVLALVMGLCFSTSSDAYAKEDAKKLDIVPVTMDSTGHSTAVIKSDGTLWMWGYRAPVIDKLPDIWYDSVQSSPVKVMENVLSVSCGGGHVAVIKDDSSLWTWGDASGGKLGNGETEGGFLPTKIMDDVVMVSCGNSHTAVIKADGSLWLFGSNLHGQIGNGGKGNTKAYYNNNKSREYSLQTIPEKIMDDVVYVSCGDQFTAAIKKDGTLWTWGYNMYGQLGNGKCAPGKAVVDFSADVYTPQMIMKDVVLVSCGYAHAAAIKKDSSLWIWGVGYLGAEGSTGYTKELVPIKIADDAMYVRCDYEDTAVVKTDGSLWLCGFDPIDSHLIPKLTKSAESGYCLMCFKGVFTGCAVKNNGNLYGWGEKKYLGIGSDSDERRVGPVKILENVMLPNTPSIVVKQEVDAAIETGLVPKSLQKNYQKLITRGNLEKLLTQLIKQVGKDANVREIVTDSDGTFNPKGKVTESRFVTVIKRTAKVLGVKYKSFGLKKTKTKLTTERAIVMAYRAYNMLIR